MNKLVELLQYGQSYWLDNLSRKMIEDGELEKRVTEQGLRGITSNPSIFNKAIMGSNAYDDQIKTLSKEGKTVQEIYEALTVKDVQDACDVMKRVYDEADGTDGFVSLEVSPLIARDTESSIKEARRLHHAVNRPNCMIKIPGTKEGVPAIEQLLYEGININITLLFSIEGYEAVAHAYIEAVRRRIEEGKSVDKVISVASFFLSRIDVLTDQLLTHHIVPSNTKSDEQRLQEVMGKTGIASAKIAYQHFKQLFSDDQWKRLAAAGAHIQRPLWASTSNKDPKHSDVRYVNALIAPDTINTLPNETIIAFADHGTLKNTIEENLKEAQEQFSRLEYFDIDIDFITKQLENEGIQKFIDAYTALLEGLAEKKTKMSAN